jgi:hypothetical protein
LVAKVKNVATDANKIRVAKLASATGWQARGRRLDQIVAEHKDCVTVTLQKPLPAGLTRRSRLAEPKVLGGLLIPKDSQVMEIGGTCENENLAEVVFGIPWTPQEFVDEALKLDHPFSAYHVPPEFETAVFKCLTLGPKEVARLQECFFEKWEAEATRLESAEKVMAAFLHADVQSFALAKKPLVFEAILRETKFPATDLVMEYLKEGFPMFGGFANSGVFPAREHTASVTKKELLKTAKWVRPALLNSRPAPSPPEVEKDLVEATEKELRNGECRGPFTPEELDVRHPEGWLPAKRIGVTSKGSTRACDDYRDANTTCESQETVDTDGPDAILAGAELVGKKAWRAFYASRVIDDIDVVPRSLLWHIWSQVHKASTLQALKEEAPVELKEQITERITERVAKIARKRSANDE